MEVRPDGSVNAGLAETQPRRLSRDRWFWLALLLGPAVAVFGAYALSGEVAVHIQLERWRELIWLAVIYPLIEEWLFRGLIQARLQEHPFGGRSLLGVSLANIVTSLLFAAFHLFTHAPLWALSVMAPSLVFGWFWDRYRSIFPGTLLHCGYNLSYFVVFGLPPASLGL